MLFLIIALIVLGLVAATAGIFHYRNIQKRIERGEVIEESPVVEEECCGSHSTCEKDSLLTAVSKDIEYYEDEDLDRFRGVASEEYSEDQIEEFREILYTLKSEEVAGWVRSLQLRAIELPTIIKDEVLLVVGERRFHD
ncbi:MAG: phospholipase [Bacteroidales bacterium]